MGKVTSGAALLNIGVPQRSILIFINDQPHSFVHFADNIILAVTEKMEKEAQLKRGQKLWKPGSNLLLLNAEKTRSILFLLGEVGSKPLESATFLGVHLVSDLF